MKPVVLIVEDEFVIAFDIKEILNEEGYNAIINISSVEEAILAIEQHKPSLILIDINLKRDKDGIDLGKYLLVKDTIPFIYITSNSDKTTVQRVCETRPHGFIVKPFKPIDIKSTVAIVLNNFKHRNIDVIRKTEEITSDIPFILKESIKYIDENITEKILVTELAKRSRWNLKQYRRLFIKYMGVNPHIYITEKKLERAKTMILETSIPIYQISFDLGFKSYSNFCQVFKKKYGKSPEHFKNLDEIKNKFIND